MDCLMRCMLYGIECQVNDLVSLKLRLWKIWNQNDAMRQRESKFPLVIYLVTLNNSPAVSLFYFPCFNNRPVQTEFGMDGGSQI